MACSGGICRLLSRTFGASPFAVLPLKNDTRHVVARSLWNDCWESKYRETDCNRCCRAALDVNSCHRHHLVAQEDCACERTTPSSSRGDSCNLLKGHFLEHQRPELGATFHSCARALAASESALFCALAEDSEGTCERCTMGLR